MCTCRRFTKKPDDNEEWWKTPAKDKQENVTVNGGKFVFHVNLLLTIHTLYLQDIPEISRVTFTGV